MVQVIWQRLLQPTGRFRRRSLSLVVRPFIVHHTFMTEMFCYAYDETSKYEYRRVRFVGVPSAGHFLRLRRDDAAEDSLFEITRVEHYDRETEPARIWVAMRPAPDA
jgi:hypothetical protein